MFVKPRILLDMESKKTKISFALMSKFASVNTPSPGFHLAFSAPSREAVDSFHKNALENSGHDNGPPGLRPHYGPTYYAAFVVDPDGHHIEAVINN